MVKRATLVPEFVERRILLIRGQKVMLDLHLASLYGVPTKSLNLAVKRNFNRFPQDFMFQLTEREFVQVSEVLRFQSETSRRGGRRYRPYVFTEQGVAMLSSVLHSERAVQINIAIMRTFVKLREMLATHKELALKLKELEMKFEKHDEHIQTIFEAIRQLMTPPDPPKKRPIGFGVEEPKVKYRWRENAAPANKRLSR